MVPKCYLSYSSSNLIRKEPPSSSCFPRAFVLFYCSCCFSFLFTERLSVENKSLGRSVETEDFRGLGLGFLTDLAEGCWEVSWEPDHIVLLIGIVLLSSISLMSSFCFESMWGLVKPKIFLLGPPPAFMMKSLPSLAWEPGLGGRTSFRGYWLGLLDFVKFYVCFRGPNEFTAVFDAIL